MRDVTTNNNDNVLPAHPQPIADTSTPYDDDEIEEQENTEKTTKINPEDYFEIIMMTSPVAGVKYYMPRHTASNAHVLIIQNPTKTKAIKKRRAL